MKRVLITGAGSYVGTKVRERLERQPELFEVDELDVRDSAWREFDFSGYDCVYHVAGIAHVSTDSKMESLYMSVNRDLAIEVGKKAKQSGVRQFIFMSSAIVYGDSDPIGLMRPITEDTRVNPSNYYGLSKLEAEIGLMELSDSTFRIAILRCPMIYGPNCKGNYSKLVKLSSKAALFPYIVNRRSMLYVENLAELIVHLIKNQCNGLYLPQNREWVCTSELVKALSETQGKTLHFLRIGSLGSRFFNQQPYLRKAFGNLYYAHQTKLKDIDYQLVSFRESVSKSIGMDGGT